MGSNNTPINCVQEANQLLTAIAPAISSTGFDRSFAAEFIQQGLYINPIQSPKLTEVTGNRVTLFITPEMVTVKNKINNTTVAEWTTGAVKGHYVRTGKVNLI